MNNYKKKIDTQKFLMSLFISIGVISVSTSSHANTYDSYQRKNKMVNTRIVKTWKEIRDSRLTKQDHDYSCGASSLSTILTYFYQIPVDEIQLLQDMAEEKQQNEIMASFYDLAKVSKKYGFTGKGFATNYDNLKKIKIPAIVYLNHRRSDHFSVVRAIDNTHVYLSDSSWGNRILTRKQFEKMWNTRNDESLKGRVLLILPTTDKQKQLVNDEFVKIQDTQRLLKQTPQLFQEFL